MAFSFILVSDSFTRANSANLGANWTNSTGATSTTTFKISSNSAVCSATARATAFWSANTFANDQWGEVLANSGGSGTRLAGIALRATTSDNAYICTVNFNALGGANSAQIAKIVNGTFTSLNTAIAAAGTNPYLIYAEVIGTTINLYINGVLTVTTTDSTFASGSVGLHGYDTQTPNTNWRGGDFVWTRKGTVIAANQTHTSGQGNQEPSVLYEGNAQILSGNVFKMWHTDGWTTANVAYAESTDGVSWTEYASNPVMSGAVHGRVVKISSTYYGFEGNAVAPNTSIDRWTASDGITWTKTNTSILSIGGTGAWDHFTVDNPFVWSEGSTWYMVYAGAPASNRYSAGLASSTDSGVTWTKYGNNPVIPNIDAGGSVGSISLDFVSKVGGIYYGLGHGTAANSNVPSDVYLYASTDLHTWTASLYNTIVERLTADEGANVSASGQLADPWMVEVAGTTYLFNDATAVQSSGNIHINLRTTAQTMAAYFAAAGFYSISGNAGTAGATVSYTTGAGSGSVIADGSGNYTFAGLPNGSYTVTPSLAGYTFAPVNSGQTVANANITGVNFTATLQSAAQVGAFLVGI